MISFKKATNEDVFIYFNWANDPIVREQSFSSELIDLENHKKWFFSKLLDPLYNMLIFQDEQKSNIGQVRIQKTSENDALIGISIDLTHRGKKYAKEMLLLSSNYFLNKNPHYRINAFIKEQNLNSKYAFENAGFTFLEILDYEGFKSLHYIKKNI